MFDYKSPCFTHWRTEVFVSESVYDLLPKELQLPPAEQQDKPTMSQKSGGEAGPPPPAALASGRTGFTCLLSLRLYLSLKLASHFWQALLRSCLCCGVSMWCCLSSHSLPVLIWIPLCWRGYCTFHLFLCFSIWFKRCAPFVFIVLEDLDFLLHFISFIFLNCIHILFFLDFFISFTVF